MIQPTTDPKATSRTAWRAAAAEARDKPLATAQRSRSGHAWPFISHYDERAQQQRPRAPDTQSGS